MKHASPDPDPQPVSPAPSPATGSAPTYDEALANAARILLFAEAETNLALAERLEKIADSWINIAGLQNARDQA